MSQAKQFITSGSKEGSLMPLIYMMTIGTGGGMATNALKDFVQGRGGPTQDKHALRERSFNKLAATIGCNPDIHGPADTFLGNYTEGLMMLGGFGLITDLLYQAAQQADNKDWGYTRYLGDIFGPTAEFANMSWDGFRAGKESGSIRVTVTSFFGAAVTTWCPIIVPPMIAATSKAWTPVEPSAPFFLLS